MPHRELNFFLLLCKMDTPFPHRTETCMNTEVCITSIRSSGASSKVSHIYTHISYRVSSPSHFLFKEDGSHYDKRSMMFWLSSMQLQSTEHTGHSNRKIKCTKSGQKLHSIKAGLEQSMSQGKQSVIYYAMIRHSASGLMPQWIAN